MQAFKVAVKAKGTNRIHGINFRDFVEKIANSQNPQIKGQIRNRKKEEDVELQIISESENAAKEFFEKVKTEAKKKIGVETEFSQIISTETPGFFENKFEVVREDELKEMYWALQGAKDIFLKLYKASMTSETIKEQHRLAGLGNEIKKMRADFSYSPEKQIAEYKDAAITNFMIEPFDENLNIILNELASALSAYNKNKG